MVADYFGVSFLELLHGVAGSKAEAAKAALVAGIDVELPTVRCYGAPLVEAVRAGTIDESLIDRAVTRVLRQKCELGMLDPDWTAAATGAPRAGPGAGRGHRGGDDRPRPTRRPGHRPPARRGVGGAAVQRPQYPAVAGPAASRWSGPSPTTSPRCSAATPSLPTCGGNHVEANPTTVGRGLDVVAPHVGREGVAAEHAAMSSARGPDHRDAARCRSSGRVLRPLRQQHHRLLGELAGDGPGGGWVGTG